MSHLGLLTLLLLIPTAAWGAIAEVNAPNQRASNSCATADTCAVNVPNNVTSGNVVIATGTWFKSDSSSTTATLSGTRTTWTTLASKNSVATQYGMVIGCGTVNSTGAETVTLDGQSASEDLSIGVTEFSGVSSCAPDADGGFSTGNDTAPTDTVTTVAANALVVGVFHYAGATGPTMAAGSGYTTIAEQESNAIVNFHGEFKIAGAAGSQTVDGTLSVSRDWGMKTASYAPTVTAAGPILGGGLGRGGMIDN